MEGGNNRALQNMHNEFHNIWYSIKCCYQITVKMNEMDWACNIRLICEHKTKFSPVNLKKGYLEICAGVGKWRAC